MKLHTKIGMAAMALILAVSMIPVTAFAKPSSTGPEPDVDDGDNSIYIHKFEKARGAYPTTEGNGEQITDTSGFGDRQNGVTFIIQKVEESVDGGHVPNGVDHWKTLDSWTVKPPSGGAATSTNAAYSAFKGGYFAATTGGNPIQFGDLEYGLYKITEIPLAGYTPMNNPYYVEIPTQLVKTAPDGTQTIHWLYDVHTYPKNIKENILHKRLKQEYLDENDPASVIPNGNKYKWEYTIGVPVMDNTSTYMRVKDQLDKRLKVFDPDENVTVYYYNQTKSQEGVVDEKYYTVTYDVNNLLSVEFLKTPKTGETDNGVDFLLGIQGGTLEIEITTHVVGKISGGGAEPLVNGGTLVWDKDGEEEEEKIPPDKPDPDKDPPNDPDPKTPKKPPYTDTGDLVLIKVDSKNSAIKLQGAEFQIYTTEKAAIEKDTKRAVINGTPDNFTFVTDEDGILTVPGMQRSKTINGATTYHTYWLVETKAPVGADGRTYNLLTAPQKFTLEEDKDGKITLTVANNNGFTLPLTGGRGTLYFTIGGLGLITVAGVVFMIYRRRQTETENDQQ